MRCSSFSNLPCIVPSKPKQPPTYAPTIGLSFDSPDQKQWLLSSIRLYFFILSVYIPVDTSIVTTIKPPMQNQTTAIDVLCSPHPLYMIISPLSLRRYLENQCNHYRGLMLLPLTSPERAMSSSPRRIAWKHSREWFQSQYCNTPKFQPFLKLLKCLQKWSQMVISKTSIKNMFSFGC